MGFRCDLLLGRPILMMDVSGAPNDVFLKYIENTLLAIHKVLLAQSIEIHFKRRSKICIIRFGHSRGT